MKYDFKRMQRLYKTDPPIRRAIDAGPYGLSHINILVASHFDDPFRAEIATTVFGSTVVVWDDDGLRVATAHIDIKGVALTTEEQTAAAEWLHDMALTMNAK